MKLLLTSAYDTHAMLDVMLELAQKDRIGRHSLCSSPEEADAIVFIENAHFDDYLYKRLRKHPFLDKFPKKVFMYNEVDKPWSVMSGLYCSMPNRFFQPQKHVPFPYIQTPNKFIKEVHKWDIEKRWLFSFVGAASHRCRREVIALGQSSQGVQDTSDFNVWDSTENVKAAQGQNFAQTMAESHFMLCPRGIGTSSFRLFETMEAGRAPVIISNQWVPPPHVDWDFAVRVNERDIKSIPKLLRSIADESEERGQAARAAWESAYAPDVLFDTTAESIGWLLAEKRTRVESNAMLTMRRFAIGSEVKILSAARSFRRQMQQVLF